jgi:hypothetical protein
MSDHYDDDHERPDDPDDAVRGRHPSDDESGEAELLDAVLEGDATPGQRAVVDADPAMRARLEALRTIRAALSPSGAAPADGVDDEARERRIATALAAADDVAPIRAATSADRSDRLRRVLVGIAAAVVVLGAVGVGLLRRPDTTTDSASSPSSAGATTSTTRAPGAAATADAPATARSLPAPTSTVAAPEMEPALGDAATLPDLGSYAGVADLDARLRASSAASADVAPLSATPIGPCAATAVALDAEPVGTARIGGRPVVVLRDRQGAAIALSLPDCHRV